MSYHNPNTVVSEVQVSEAEHNDLSGRELVRVGSRRLFEMVLLYSELETYGRGQLAHLHPLCGTTGSFRFPVIIEFTSPKMKLA